MRHRFVLLACSLLILVFTLPSLAQSNAAAATETTLAKWNDTPDAYFLTEAEQQEWWSFKTDEERRQFIDRYWARRDPTPGTPVNEFQEAITKRIEAADERFRVGEVRGSMTDKGQVYIIFGAPSRMKDDRVTAPSAGDPFTRGSNGNETNSTWYYDQARTPRVLEMLNRPSLEFTFVVDPNRRRDQLQNPGLMHTLREQLAQRSIVSTVLKVTRPLATIIEASSTATIPADVARHLDAAHEPGAAPLRTASVWRNDGKPLALAWITIPKRGANEGPLMLFGRVRDAEQRVVAQIAREVGPAEGFSTGADASVYAAQLQLPSGAYDADFVLVEQNDNSAPVAKSSGKVIVPQDAGGFAVSSLLLTHEIALQPSMLSAVDLGRTPLRPRADATFSTRESMWYVFEVANPTDASKVAVTARLRGNGEMKSIDVQSGLTPMAGGHYIGGYELPLKSIAPGDYTLYVTIADGGRQEVRRADFRVVEPVIR
ncbi:MAG TPA: GWxTD domain-containing protein [Thermoanaerobaculia bacterium]|nr:GWxTD domain-containing protein [Thermoanaerobaculia bacterium]